MRHFTPPHALVIMAVLALSAAEPARADFLGIEPRCFTVFGTSPFSPAQFTSTFAGPAQDRTSVGSGTETESEGWNFDTTTEEILVCSFVVPPTYDQNSDYQPVVHLYGWGVTNHGCSSSRSVGFKTSSRAYHEGLTANSAWSTEDNASIGIPCTTNGCGLGVDCALANVVHESYGDLTADAGDWSPGDLVYIRIRRDTAGDDYGYDFHLASLLIKVPEVVP